MPNLGTTEKLIFTITSAGAGVTGQTPSIVIQKQGSSQYFFNGTGFAPSYIELNMTEESSTNFPGRYFYSFNQALDNNITNASESYSIRYKNTGTYALVVDEELNFSLPNTISYTAQSLPGIEFTRPGFQNPEQTYFVSQNNEKRIKSAYIDSNGVYYDPFEITIQAYSDSTLLYTETIIPPLNGTYIKRDSAGNYYIDFTQTTNTGECSFIWKYRDISGGEAMYATQYLNVAPIQLINLIPNLKNQIDKSQKDSNTIFGLTDSNLFYYLKGGLSEINRVSPTTSFTFSSYPYQSYSQLLIDVSTITYMMSTGMLACDSDSSYTLQGNSFVVDHVSKLNSLMTTMFANVNAAVRVFKLNYAGSATKVERGANWRGGILFNSSQNGINFGNFLSTR